MTTLRTGLVGCGKVGHTHASALAALAESEFVAVCDRLAERAQAFAAHYGADFYQLPRNREQITLNKTSWVVPEQLSFAGEKLVPLRAGESMVWKMV